MTVDAGISADWQESRDRVVAYSVAIGLHLGLLLLLLRAPAPNLRQPYTETGDAKSRLHLRFIDKSPWRPYLPAVHLTQTASTMPKGKSSRRRENSAIKTTPAANHFVATDPSLPTATGQDTPAADTQETSTRIEPGYIAGGGLFRNSLQDRWLHNVLPGSDKVLVENIQLIDPSKQGISAVTRKVQHRFGIPDHHCVDVDAWRSMSTQDLINRHLTPAQVEHAAGKYRCDFDAGAIKIGHQRP